MPKINKNQNQHKKKNVFDTKFYFLLSSLLIVFIVYSFSLFRPWQPFDERVFYSESLFPTPTRFSEIDEIIRSFVLNYHTESMNTFFSNLMTIRSNTLASILIIFVSFLFKNNAFFYHLLQLGIHIMNTTLVWVILYKCLKIYINKSLNKLEYLLISFFTLVWGLHSANTEAVLLVTNWDTILTYTFCFLFILYEINLISKSRFQTSRVKSAIIISVFTLIMFFTEYAYTLPLIILFLTFSLILRITTNIKESLLYSANKSLPYLIGLFLYIILSLCKPNSTLANIIHTSNISSNNLPFLISSFIERNIWLVPQIFIHFLKIVLFPKALTLYQSNHVHLANTFFEPYSIFCTCFYFLSITLPLILFLVFRNKRSYVFICPLFYAFYSSLIPFLHIVLPTYCLSADRYCYFPSFVLVFIFACIAFSMYDIIFPKYSKQVISILSCVLLILTLRTLVRIQEWNNPYLLYKSAIRIDKNPLYKGQKLIVFADYVGSLGKQKEMEDLLTESLHGLQSALKQLKHERKQYPDQPQTLKYYGLDLNALIIKAAYAISTIKNDNYQEPAQDTLKFYKPYIDKKINLAGINAIDLYSELLIKAGEIKRAKEVLEQGLKMYPYSSALIFELANYYFQIEKDLNKTFETLQKAYKYFPNDINTLKKLLLYYETIHDNKNIAKFSYLLGLRTHSEENYQKAAIIYLNSNELTLAHKTLKKLAQLNSSNPLTLLLSSRYLDLTGNRSQIPELLNSAYNISKAKGKDENVSVTKSILASLINVYAQKGDLVNAKKYLGDFENVRNLTEEDLKQINLIKANLN